jgi:hypothetical protein
MITLILVVLFFALLIGIFTRLGKPRHRMVNRWSPAPRTCQYCAEEIKPQAFVCKHCGKEQPAALVAPPAIKPPAFYVPFLQRK